MNTKKVQKKSVATEAVQFIGGLDNGKSMVDWFQSKDPEALAEYNANYGYDKDEEAYKFVESVRLFYVGVAYPGDWAMWDPETGFNFVKKEYFDVEYEEVEE